MAPTSNRIHSESVERIVDDGTFAALIPFSGALTPEYVKERMVGPTLEGPPGAVWRRTNITHTNMDESFILYASERTGQAMWIPCGDHFMANRPHSDQPPATTIMDCLGPSAVRRWNKRSEVQGTRTSVARVEKTGPNRATLARRGRRERARERKDHEQPAHVPATIPAPPTTTSAPLTTTPATTSAPTTALSTTTDPPTTSDRGEQSNLNRSLAETIAFSDLDLSDGEEERDEIPEIYGCITEWPASWISESEEEAI